MTLEEFEAKIAGILNGQSFSVEIWSHHKRKEVAIHTSRYAVCEVLESEREKFTECFVDLVAQVQKYKLKQLK